MMQFSLHFFKKETRHVEYNLLRAFFEARDDFEVRIHDDRSAEFIYTHPRLLHQAVFYQTKSSQVPNIYRIDAAFLDINIHVEIPILSPDYFTKEVLLIAEQLANKFDFYIYYEIFEDPIEVDIDFIMTIYENLKKAYIDRHPQVYDDYHILPKGKAGAIFRYIDELPQLQNYYRDLDVFVPKYHILTIDNNRLALAMEWRESTATVFPPFIDYIFYRSQAEVKVLESEVVFKEISDYLEPVPGFIKETRVISKANIKRAAKAMKKIRFPKRQYSFSKESLMSVLD